MNQDSDPGTRIYPVHSRGWTHGLFSVPATTWLTPTLGGWLLQLLEWQLSLLLQLRRQPFSEVGLQNY